MIYSIDPGKRVLAWALWVPSLGMGLLRCGLSIAPASVRSLSDLCSYHTKALTYYTPPADVYVEQMQLNKGRDSTLSKAIATGNDLLELQAIGAYCAGTLGRLRYLPVNTWKGTCSKEVTLQRVEATLTTEELATVERALAPHKASLHHNLFDAIGIGLHATGRYRLRDQRALPSAKSFLPK